MVLGRSAYALLSGLGYGISVTERDEADIDVGDDPFPEDSPNEAQNRKTRL